MTLMPNLQKVLSYSDLICICIWVSFQTRVEMMCPRNSSLSTLDSNGPVCIRSIACPYAPMRQLFPVFSVATH